MALAVFCENFSLLEILVSGHVRPLSSEPACALSMEWCCVPGIMALFPLGQNSFFSINMIKKNCFYFLKTTLTNTII